MLTFCLFHFQSKKQTINSNDMNIMQKIISQNCWNDLMMIQNKNNTNMNTIQYRVQLHSFDDIKHCRENVFIRQIIIF